MKYIFSFVAILFLIGHVNTAHALRIAISSTSSNGNFGGVAGADALCQGEFGASYPGTTWKAILGTSDRNKNGNDWVLQANQSYERIDSTAIGSTGGDACFSYPLTNAIDSTNTGRTWTGLKDDCTPYVLVDEINCNNWTVDTAGSIPYNAGVYGDPDSTSEPFTPAVASNTGCNESYPIYCAEQPIINSTPADPSSPSPADSTTDVAISSNLSIAYSDADGGDTVTVAIELFSTDPTTCGESGDVAGSISGNGAQSGTATFDPTADLSTNTTYYWCARASDGSDDSNWVGPLSFITAAPATTSIEDAETSIASAAISAKKKERAQGYLDHIQTVKGEDFNEELDINDPQAPEVTNALSQAAKNVRQDAAALDAVAAAVEVFIGLTAGTLSGASYTDIHSAILNWRLQ